MKLTHFIVSVSSSWQLFELFDCWCRQQRRRNNTRLRTESQRRLLIRSKQILLLDQRLLLFISTLQWFACLLAFACYHLHASKRLSSPKRRCSLVPSTVYMLTTDDTQSTMESKRQTRKLYTFLRQVAGL